MRFDQQALRKTWHNTFFQWLYSGEYLIS